MFNELARVLLAERLAQIQGDGRQLRPLRQQPVFQAGEDFIALRGRARDRARRHRLDETHGLGQGHRWGGGPRQGQRGAQGADVQEIKGNGQHGSIIRVRSHHQRFSPRVTTGSWRAVRVNGMEGDVN